MTKNSHLTEQEAKVFYDYMDKKVKSARGIDTHIPEEEIPGLIEMSKVAPNFTRAYMELFYILSVDDLEAMMASPLSCRNAMAEQNLLTEDVEKEIFSLIFAGGEY